MPKKTENRGKIVKINADKIKAQRKTTLTR